MDNPLQSFTKLSWTKVSQEGVQLKGPTLGATYVSHGCDDTTTSHLEMRCGPHNSRSHCAKVECVFQVSLLKLYPGIERTAYWA